MSDHTKRCVSAPRATDTPSTAELLEDLKTRGYKMYVSENGKLAYENPAPPMTPVVWYAIQTNYGKLVKVLSEDVIKNDIKRRVSEHVPTRATFHECPVDGRPCEVMEPVRAGMEVIMDGEKLAGFVKDVKEYGLPCDGCRKGECDARNLSGLRLGKHEWRILLAADGERYRVVYPEKPGRAAEESNRRALRKLERAGLVKLSRDHVWMGDKENPPPKWFHSGGRRYWMMGRMCRSAKLTPLGVAVVQRCRAELESSAPIRWGKLREDLAKDVRKPLPELLAQLAHWVEGAAFYANVGVMFGRTAEGKQRAAKLRESYTRLREYVAEEAEKRRRAA